MTDAEVFEAYHRAKEQAVMAWAVGISIAAPVLIVCFALWLKLTEWWDDFQFRRATEAADDSSTLDNS